MPLTLSSPHLIMNGYNEVWKASGPSKLQSCLTLGVLKVVAGPQEKWQDTCQEEKEGRSVYT